MVGTDRVTSKAIGEKFVAVLVLGYMAHNHLAAGTLSFIRLAASRLSYPSRIIYLDNYSRDGSVQWLTEYAPDVDVLVSPYNCMYCHGVNRMVQYAERRYAPDYFILADADNPSEPDAYSKLVDYMTSHPDCGIAQPLVRSISNPNAIYSCGHIYNLQHWCRAMTELPAEPGGLTDLPSCSISSTIVRRAVFEECGLLDPIFDIYYESSDLGFRARAAGFRCACVPTAVCYNEGTEATTVDSIHHRYYFNRNRILFWRMHDESTFNDVARDAVRQLARLELALAHSDFGLDAIAEGTRRGLSDGLRLASLPDFLPRPRVFLDGYRKGETVLLQTGTARPLSPNRSDS